VAGAAAALEADLTWTGLPPDESPLRGGPHGPYRQSERLALYHHHVEELLARGAAYRCFCSEKRLELLRKEAARSRAPNRYDGKCAQLAAAEIAEKMERGVPHTVRFKLRPFTEGFKDLVYGPVAHDVAQFEGKYQGKMTALKNVGGSGLGLRIQLGSTVYFSVPEPEARAVTLITDYGSGSVSLLVATLSLKKTFKKFYFKKS
jgi:glutamyl/glutaminyl-tRNA synthetase